MQVAYITKWMIFGGWVGRLWNAKFKQNIICDNRLLDRERNYLQINRCTNLWNLLWVAKDIFEDPTEVGKENCKIEQKTFLKKKFIQEKCW